MSKVSRLCSSTQTLLPAGNNDSVFSCYNIFLDYFVRVLENMVDRLNNLETVLAVPEYERPSWEAVAEEAPVVSTFLMLP